AQNFALWQQAVARSRDTLTRADDLDALASRGWPDGQRPSLRWIVVHMIEEYARHNGHADLIREAIAGSTGESPSNLAVCARLGSAAGPRGRSACKRSRSVTGEGRQAYQVVPGSAARARRRLAA